MAKEIFLTQEGYDNLKARYDHLLNVERNAVAEKIKEARDFGDLSENAEYDAAKEEQLFIEQEIKDLSEKLANVKIIAEETLNKRVVAIGSRIKIHDLEFDEVEEYKIVGTTEADVENNKISNESPLGQALIGRKKGEVIDVLAPGGTIQVKILSINA